MSQTFAKYRLFQAKLTCTYLSHDRHEMINVTGGAINPADYNQVYENSIPDNSACSDLELLEQIYSILSEKTAQNPNTRLVAISDIIELTRDDTSCCYYCCSTGFTPVTFKQRTI